MSEVNIEHLVTDAFRAGLQKMLEQQIGSYNNPVAKIAEQILAAHADQIRVLLEDAVSNALSSKVLKSDLREAFGHKVAKLLVSKLEGEVEKRVNDIRSDPIMRAKMLLAIEQVVKGDSK